jgi:hypothetical protein
MKEVRARQEESAKSFATYRGVSWSAFTALTQESERVRYLCNTANVLITALLVKAKVLVEAETDIVAVETVRGKTLLEKVLLESSGNGRLARGRETGEPDGSTLLLAELAALLAGKTSVPGDVAVVFNSSQRLQTISTKKQHSRRHFEICGMDGFEEGEKMLLL